MHSGVFLLQHTSLREVPEAAGTLGLGPVRLVFTIILHSLFIAPGQFDVIHRMLVAHLTNSTNILDAVLPG
jgi:hypothetical protein